jgi:hypothetical protein
MRMQPAARVILVGLGHEAGRHPVFARETPTRSLKNHASSAAFSASGWCMRLTSNWPGPASEIVVSAGMSIASQAS